jgi:hypothetical protein
MGTQSGVPSYFAVWDDKTYAGGRNVAEARVSVPTRGRSLNRP